MKANHRKNNIFWKIILRIYMIYVFLLFVVTFFIGTPLVFIAIATKYHRLGLQVNHYWSHIFFFLVGVRMEVVQKSKLDRTNNYIFCPNHFSFLDIAIMPMMPLPFKFVGKVSISKVPILGFVFKKLHITVDRAKLRDRYATYKKSVRALLDGYSLTIFPEGGIVSSKPPELGNFKDGAFRMAVETGTRLVPVTLVDNWHMMPDDGKFYLRRRKCRVIIHEPIDPGTYSMEKIKDFQRDVKNHIQEELNRLNAIV